MNNSSSFSVCTEDNLVELRRWNEYYWVRSDDQRWNYYLGPVQTGSDWPREPLLHLEMACAKQRGVLPEEDARPVTLAILVGESFEPLLQSIWAYRPERLVPILNAYYGDRKGEQRRSGKQQWGELRDFIERLPEAARANLKSLPTKREVHPVAEDDPSGLSRDPRHVFQTLYEQLRDDLTDPKKRRVIIDITGAKKTMVVGAFLLAAYTDADIAYVDFDSYHKEKGRPYGYTCRFRLVENPLEVLALREWERGAELYQQHDFTGALTVLPKEPPAKMREWKEALASLRKFLEVCSQWENGDLHMAKEATKLLPIALKQLVPLTVTELGDDWPGPDAERAEWLSVAFLSDPRKLVIYACDELARARRLLARDSETRRDTRAAFARAYALHETLIKARIVIAYEQGNLLVRRKHPDDEQWKSDSVPPEVGQLVRLWLLNRLQTDQALDLLQKDDRQGQRFGEKSKHDAIHLQLWRAPERDYPDPALSLPDELDTEGVGYTRNLIIHTYVPVSQSDAQAAIKLARANLDDYRQRWGKWLDKEFKPNWEPELSTLDVPSWKTLKDACGLDFIPDSHLVTVETT